MSPARPRFVSYLRVSTDGQGRSGLGLEAQRQAVAAHVAQAGGEVVTEFQEVESGKRADRPQLAAALASWGRRTICPKLHAKPMCDLSWPGVQWLSDQRRHRERWLQIGPRDEDVGDHWIAHIQTVGVKLDF